MAKNDSIIIDGIIDERVSTNLPSSKRDEAFEYFAFEQILKDVNLSQDELLLGRVDGRNDGGIDGFFIIINGHLLSDIESSFLPKANAELEVHIITCKHDDTFIQAPLDKLVATLSEILDFSIDRKDLKGSYNNEVLRLRDLLKSVYRKLASKITSLKINVSYASRGDSSIVGESILARGNQIKQIIDELFGIENPPVSFFGSGELVNLSRRIPNFTLELPFISILGRGERYVLLSKINDYYNFVSDESNKLRRYLFDSNVRDFMGLNRVNEDIKATLENQNSPDFWWLNNGVTILANSAKIIGNSILVGDIQIVNGLQTTESIFRFFSSGNEDPNERAVLVKIIVSLDPAVRDNIIRATNNQTIVELTALKATDKIQRDIEDVMLKNGIFYERRANYYFNQGVKPSEIVTPLYLASGYIAFILKQPHISSRLKSRFMRNPESYNRIFSEDERLDIWPIIAKILKLTDVCLEGLRPSKNTFTEHFLKRWRYILSYLTVSRILGKFNFNANDIAKFHLENYTEEEILKTWRFINASTSKPNPKMKWFTIETFINVFRESAQTEKIGGLEEFIKYKRFNIYPAGKNLPVQPKSQIKVTEEFVNAVNKLLPEQPWKPGTHLLVANELKCSSEEVYAAVNILIEKGQRFKQKDGIVYDNHGKILKIDKNRVDEQTLLLREID